MTGRLTSNEAVVCVIGLGYVGLPLAQAFARQLKVIGIDNDQEKVGRLKANNSLVNLFITGRPEEIKEADFIIICVPTPINKSKEPDLSAIKEAARMIAKNMKPGCTVILESSVYPGVTEDVVKPILEKESGLACGKDFMIGYSPERINPGDDEHSVEKVVKVVAGLNDKVTDTIAGLYRKVTPQVFKARNIKTAEAAKITENVQRDLNIALMNELAVIFERLGLDSKDVLDAAATKWNFHRYSPGLVGGYCIPVVPYYLVHKAREMGYEPGLILAGRNVSNAMPAFVAEVTAAALKRAGKTLKKSRILIVGLTYKENVSDARESPVIGIVQALKKDGAEVYGYDPLLDSIEKDVPIKAITNLADVKNIDAIIVAVGHDAFREITPGQLKKITAERPVLVDIKRIFNRDKMEREGFAYYSI